MKVKFTELSGSIVAPRGFVASGVFCDIKRLGTGKGSNFGATWEGTARGADCAALDISGFRTVFGKAASS